MKKLLPLLAGMALALVCGEAVGQDMERTIDDLPAISSILLKILDKSPAFVARAEVRAAYADDPKPTAASGPCAWQAGMFRWDADARKIEGPLVPERAMHLVAQLRLAPLVLLARADRRNCSFILGGARACLESKLVETTAARKSAGGEEMLDGKRCQRERTEWKLGKRAASATLWKFKEKPGLPARLKIATGGLTVEILFHEPRAARQEANRFEVPAGFVKHTQFEDVVQSVLIEKMRSKFGLPAPN